MNIYIVRIFPNVSYLDIYWEQIVTAVSDEVAERAVKRAFERCALRVDGRRIASIDNFSCDTILLEEM